MGRRAASLTAGLLAALFVLAAAPTAPAGTGDDRVVPSFDGSAALRWVERQCALGPRVPGTKAHRAWLRMVGAYLDSLGLSVTRQGFSHPSPLGPDTLHLTNLLVRVRPGLSPRLLLGAHWDSRPWSDQEPDPALQNRPVPGANDGASGVAVLLVLAGILARQGPPLGVDLAFFDLEDMGREGTPEEYCLGSRFMAEGWVGSPPDWVVVLDMVGANNLQIGRELYSQSQAPELQELLFRIAADRGFAEFNPALQLAIEDDHLSFQRIGVESVVLIGFNDPVWHTQRDTPDHISTRSLEHVGEVVCELIYGGRLVP